MSNGISDDQLIDVIQDMQRSAQEALNIAQSNEETLENIGDSIDELNGTVRTHRNMLKPLIESEFGMEAIVDLLGRLDQIRQAIWSLVFIGAGHLILLLLGFTMDKSNTIIKFVMSAF